jgi:hypothetical protein
MHCQLGLAGTCSAFLYWALMSAFNRICTALFFFLFYQGYSRELKASLAEQAASKAGAGEGKEAEDDKVSRKYTRKFTRGLQEQLCQVQGFQVTSYASLHPAVEPTSTNLLAACTCAHPHGQMLQ